MKVKVKEKKEERRTAYFVKDNPTNRELCPICNHRLGSCHIGDYCGSEDCPGRYCDGIARLTKKQVKEFKDLIIRPWNFKP